MITARKLWSVSFANVQ